MKFNKFMKWITTIGGVILILTLWWAACTQKSPMDPTKSLREEVPLLIDIQASPSQIATGGAQSEIRVRLVDQDGQSLINQVVLFTTNLGDITSEVTTDTSGWAKAILTSGDDSGVANVTAKYGELALKSISIKFISPTQALIQIETQKKEIFADGVEKTNIIVTVLSDSAVAVPGAQVSFSTTFGAIIPSVTTDREGIGTVFLTSAAHSRDTTATVTARYDTLSVAAVVVFKGIQFTVNATPSAILADGKSISKITAFLKETTSNVAISSVKVRFGTNLGKIPNEETTNSEGVAQVSLTSETTTGTANVVAYYGKTFTENVQVVLLPETEIPYTISEITRSSSEILANGVEQVTISVKVLDGDHNPVSGDSIRFGTTSGMLGSELVVTDKNGIASTLLTARASSNDSTATVTASRGRGVQSVTTTVEFLGIQFEISASPTQIFADGQSSSTITVILKKMLSQVAISGAKVSFGTNLGTISNEAETNNEGVANVTLGSSTITGTAHVVASYGETIADTVDIIFFIETPTDPILSAITVEPNVILANGIDQSSISVKVLDSNADPISGTLVGFSTTAGEINAQGVTDKNGVTTVNLTSIASNADIVSTVTAQLNTQSLKTSVTFLGVQLEISALPVAVVADGINKSTIQVVLKQKTNQVAISDAKVSFGTNLGTIPNEMTTNNQGLAQVSLTSSITTGTAHVVASYGAAIVDTIDVIFYIETPALPILSSITASTDIILANGINQSSISVNVIDNNSNPISGVLINFSAIAGEIESQSVTDQNGIASVKLTSVASTSDLIDTVTARLDTQSVKKPVVFKGIQLELSASPVSIIADGKSSSNIKLVLKQTTNQVAISGAEVIFSTNLGTIPNEATTNLEGVTQVTLKSETTAGIAYITAYYGKTISETVQVAFLPDIEVTTISEITATPSQILANGIAQSIISVKVVDSNQNSVSGDSIRFVTTTGIIKKEWVLTDKDGIASTVLTVRASSNDSTATVTASRVGGIQSITTTIAFIGIQLELTASPTAIIADGKSTSSIQVIIKQTTSKIAILNAAISFSTDIGTIPNSANTNTSGVANVDLTSGTTTGTAHVVAVYGSTISDTVDVSFYTEVPVPPTLSEINVSSNSILANGVDQSTINAKVVDSNSNPVSGILVSFSTDEGVINSQGVTDQDGIATVQLTSSASSSDLTATVTADLDGQTLLTTVDFLGIQLELTASPSAIIADGQSTSNIKVILKQITSQVAVSGADISFSTDLGTIPNWTTTNSLGVAQVSLSSGIITGTANVIARYGNIITDTVNVDFQSSVPTYLEVSATPPVLTADGESKSVIKATVSDAFRNPVPDGTTVIFDLIGSGQIGRQKATVGGVATTSLTSGIQPDTVKVCVTVDNLADTIEVIYKVGEVNQILVSSDRDSMDADGIETATIQARVFDAQGNPIKSVTVLFSASIGDITPSAQTNSQGVAIAQYSSGEVGIATITATVNLAEGGSVSGITTIRLLPGGPNSIVLQFDPTSIGVMDTGQEQTATVEADVRDSKNNPVVDGTYVKFSILAGPGGGEFLSSYDPVPTVSGIARVSFSSGNISGNVRIQAEVTDADGNPILSVKAIAAEILIHAGEAYIEDINNLSTSHLTIVANRLNIWAGMDTTKITIMVGDKYNNPVQKGTAVYLTTSGGVVNTHTAYTDEYGKATVVLTAGNPQPTIDRFYNYNGMQDPNLDTVIPGYVYYPDLLQSLIPNFDAFPDSYYPGTIGGRILNTEGDSLENDGITRIIAYSEGKDSTGNSVRAWDWLSVVFSGHIAYFEENSAVSLPDTLHPGDPAAIVRLNIMDANGNPIACGSKINAELVPDEVQARLSWSEIKTRREQGTSYYYIGIQNAIKPDDPKPGYVSIKFSVESVNGEGFITTQSVYISAN